MALMGYEVWALVFQTLAGNAIYLAGLWITSQWKPGIVFSIQSFKSLFNFGYKILLQGLTDVIFTKSYFPLIGKLFPLAQLGFYTNANRFYDLFIRQTSNSVNRVIFPAFAIIQDDKERFNTNYIRSFNLLATAMFMGSVLLIVVSRPFVELALTEKWLPAVPLMKLFFIEGFFFPLLLMNLNILNSAGRSGASLKIDIIKKSLIALSVIILFRFGIEALIVGQVTATFISFVGSLVVISKYHNVRLNKIGITLIRLCVIMGISFLTSFLLIEPLNISDWAELLIKCAMVPVMFYGFGRIMHIEAIDDLKDFLGSYILQRRKS
jgi:O-antigen/teichoic acid export membrane protein